LPENDDPMDAPSPALRRIPATAAGLAALLASPTGAAAAAGGYDIELLCAPPLHHRLEFAGLYGLLAALAAGAADPAGAPRLRPPPRVRLWMRSALTAAAPFALLPAAVVARLPDDGDEAACAAVAALPRAGSGAVGVLLGSDAAWERRLAAGGAAGAAGSAWWQAVPPRDFQWRLPTGADAASATAAFLAAATAASPTWVTAPPSPTAAGRLRRVLVYQARSHLGDALWLTPLLRALAEAVPGIEITVLAAPGALPALATNRRLAELLPLPAADPPAARAALLRHLAARRFDAALFAFARRPAAQWLAAAVAGLGVPRRINLEYFDAASDGREPSPLFTDEGWFFWGTLPSPRLLLHALDPLLGPAPRDRRIELPLAAAWRLDAEAALTTAALAGRRFAILSPGARSSTRWPARKFAALAERLAADLDLAVVVEGSAGEAELLADVERRLHRRRRRGAGPAIVVRQDSFGTLAALLERAALLVSNDSAPIHLAEATGTPTLYLAHHEKLIHSHPGHDAVRALFDAARNRPARLGVGAVAAAAAALLAGPADDDAALHAGAADDPAAPSSTPDDTTLPE
jgi:ADP-heptose:LPS heptosyltransferase